MDEAIPARLAERLTAPAAELDQLSFCESSAAALEDWIGRLPMANTSTTSEQIRQATFEIARLKIPYALRMALLEVIRPPLHYLCARLDRAAMSTQNHGDAIARLAQRLQTNLCSGYKAVILEAIGSGSRTDKETVATAIHRVLSDLSRTLLRTLQFYVAPADRLWLELNQLYHLAEHFGLTLTEIHDSENHTRPQISIRDAYLRPVLLALAKPNQLRHRQLTDVFNALELWVPSVTIEASEGGELFCVDLAAEQGPSYTKLLEAAEAPRCVRTELLVYELEAYRKDMDGSLPVPERLEAGLIAHLANAWSVMRKRTHRRAASTSSMKVCIGMRSAHYFLSGGVDFFDQLDEEDASVRREVNPFQGADEVAFVPNVSEIKDVWDDAFDLRVRIPQNPNIGNPEALLRKMAARQGEDTRKDNRGGYHYYDTTTMDTSPGGYRVRWNEPLPASVQTGELVAMRDESDPRWCVAVIRWIRQDANGASMGLELLSPRAIPVAVRVIHKRGGPSDYARAFVLPELALIDQPASLLAPPVPFQSNQKVHVSRQGIQTTAQLGECLLKTESFNQFTFRMLDGYLENTEIDLTMNSLRMPPDDQPSGLN
ncbi:MAG: hypothetical protein R3E82_22110 [Pseudomonadales bacterium]